MTVLERSELEASPLADLHAIANQLGLDGFRRLRKAELIDAIVERSGGAGAGPRSGSATGDGEADSEESGADAAEERPRSRRGVRSRRTRASAADDTDGKEKPAAKRRAAADEEDDEEDRPRLGARRRPPRSRRARPAAESEVETESESGSGSDDRDDEQTARTERGGRAPRRRGGRGGREERGPYAERGGEREVEGVVELLGNGSAFLRVAPPDASDEDVYISAAQVRRCELVSGDRVTGPVRPRRASERYPSLARIDTINGAPAESVAEGTRYEDLPVGYPTERLALDAEDPTLSAIEWLTPIGRGSRALIVGAARAGKTETLLRLRDALTGRDGLEVMVVLAGIRPEEIAAWRPPAGSVGGERVDATDDDAAARDDGAGAGAPLAAVNLAASAELQDQTVEHAVDTAKRVAARGGDVVVLIDSLDGLHPHVARRVLAAARNLSDGGSLTVIATATRPFGGESTVIALDVALTSTGRFPALDLAASGATRPELLVGEDGARAITEARAKALHV